MHSYRRGAGRVIGGCVWQIKRPFLNEQRRLFVYSIIGLIGACRPGSKRLCASGLESALKIEALIGTWRWARVCATFARSRRGFTACVRFGRVIWVGYQIGRTYGVAGWRGEPRGESRVLGCGAYKGLHGVLLDGSRRKGIAGWSSLDGSGSYDSLYRVVVIGRVV